MIKYLMDKIFQKYYYRSMLLVKYNKCGYARLSKFRQKNNGKNL